MGSIRKKEKVINGKAYTYYEARYTVGIDPGTGKQIQKSISGKTQREVTRRLKEITTSIDTGTYLPSCKLTVGEWLNTCSLSTCSMPSTLSYSSGWAKER